MPKASATITDNRDGARPAARAWVALEMPLAAENI
jgi:hypothetical protein